MGTDRSAGEWSALAGQNAALAQIGQMALRARSLGALLDHVVAVVAATLGVDDVVLLEVRDRTSVVGRAAWLEGRAVPAHLLTPVRIALDRTFLAGFTVLEGEQVVIDDVATDDRFEILGLSYGIDCRAAVTAVVGPSAQPWGVIGVYSSTARAWTDDDARFVAEVGTTVGLAVARQQVTDGLQDLTARLSVSLAAGRLGAWTWDRASNRIELSDAARAMCGLGPVDRLDDGDQYLERVHPEDQAAVRSDLYEAIQTSGEQHTEYRIVRPDGQVRWLESWGRLLGEPDSPDRMVGVVADITERRRADEARASLLAAEKQARATAEAARERLGILADASDRFSATLDPDEVTATLAEVCVPLLADVCIIDVLVDEGELVEAVVRSRDDQSRRDLTELRRRRRELGGVGGVWSERRVAGRAESVWMPEITDAHNRAAATDDEHLELIRRFGARSSVVVPMVARRRVLGVLTLIYNVTDRRYDEDQLVLAEELASRAALALDNGRLYASRSRVARSLQDALLPPALPDVGWLEFGARYRVADADIEIGGDFYDVIELGGEAWGVVVGDVCGRGPDAAALTGLMRHSVRAAAMRQGRPSRVLTQTNEAVLDQIDDARFCTAAYVQVVRSEDGSVRVRASSAGHPRPILLSADGRARFLECGGVLLGVVPDPPLVDAEVALAPGDAVVLYTDGVTEARHGRDLFGERHLLRTLADLAGTSAEGIAAGLDRAVGDYQDGATDDIAIVVVRVPDPSGD